MSTAIAKNLMAEMKLLGMLGTFEKALSDATRDQISYSEFLDMLLQAEADYRQERKTGYRVKAAKFTLRPAFEDIDFTASRSISKAQIKELYSLHWLNDARPRAIDRPNRRRQDLYRPGHGAARLRLRQIGPLSDTYDVVGEPRAREIQWNVPPIPRQARQAGRRDHRRLRDAKALLNRSAGSMRTA